MLRVKECPSVSGYSAANANVTFKLQPGELMAGAWGPGERKGTLHNGSPLSMALEGSPAGGWEPGEGSFKDTAGSRSGPGSFNLTS